jgi:hypothetical protein
MVSCFALHMTSDRCTGQVMHDDRILGIGGGKVGVPGSTTAITLALESATITDASVGALCGNGVDLSDQYAREITP